MSASLDYNLVSQLNDGREILIDPDQHGWADPEMLKNTKVWGLVPRDQNGMPVVTVQIPEGAKPVYKSRVVGNMKYGVSFRCYAVGYKKGSTTYWVWVLPTGNVEVGEEPQTAHLLLNHLVDLAKAAAQQASLTQ